VRALRPGPVCRFNPFDVNATGPDVPTNGILTVSPMTAGCLSQKPFSIREFALRSLLADRRLALQAVTAGDGLAAGMVVAAGALIH
jgi:hypothetical protein